MTDPASPERLVPAGPSGEALVAALEARLGLTFSDRATALAALTHKSWVNEHRDQPHGDNERLEFLGDAVIDLAVSHRLMERFPLAREGELSKMRASVVDEPGLAALARSIALGDLLRLGRGEELTCGRQKASLLADALEAVAAAVYLEAGLPGVLGIVDRFLGEAFERAANGTLDRDYKTQLQELSQSQLRAAPRYLVVAELGPDHAKVFEVAVELRGEELARAQGRSKKDAEQAAARLALDALAARVAVEAREVAAVAAQPTPAEPVPAPAPAPEVEPVAEAEAAVPTEAPPAPRKRIRKAAERVSKKVAAGKGKRPASRAAARRPRA